jgi:iron complex transport system substrate-binding protein
VACVQWLQPMLAAGAWVPELVRLAGGEDVAGSTEHAAPLSEQQLVETAPEVLVFALCGLPLRTSLAAARTALGRMRGAWRDVPALHAGRVAVVDGERVLSRPGPLLVPSLECLAEILHPEAQRFGHEGTLWQWLELA